MGAVCMHAPNVSCLSGNVCNFCCLGERPLNHCSLQTLRDLLVARLELVFMDSTSISLCRRGFRLQCVILAAQQDGVECIGCIYPKYPPESIRTLVLVVIPDSPCTHLSSHCMKLYFLLAIFGLTGGKGPSV